MQKLMIMLLVYIVLNVVTFASESQLRRHLTQISCCKDLGVNCKCRQSCGGNDCSSNSGSLCNTGVCCCGNACSKPELLGADICPTNAPTKDPTTDPTRDPTTDPTSDPTNDPTSDPTKDPTSDPTRDPTADPTKDPTSDPTNDPTSDPTSDPTKDPTSDPTKDPTRDPTTEPTIGCAAWSPESNAPTTDGSGGNNGIPVPDFNGSPQLCQLGKSGTWNSLDQWYSFDCSCYDVQTLYKLTQFVAGWFVQFQLNFQSELEGRFESYFENYSTDDVTFRTSLTTASGTSNGPSWQDLEDLTSCDPDDPGYAELTRSLPYDFEISPGGVFITDCIENGNLAFAKVNIPNYRQRDNGFTENQVSFGYLTVERDPNTNIWLFKAIEFGGATVGYLSQTEA